MRGLFDWLARHGVLETNPAAPVRGPSYTIKRGKTPILTAGEAKRLIESIETDTLVGLRDRALIAGMVYSFARISAAVGMQLEDLVRTAGRSWLRLHEKGGKVHEMPVHHRLLEHLEAYLEALGLADAKACLFRASVGRKGELSAERLSRYDAYAMVRRRAIKAGVVEKIGNHSFRGTGITTYLQNDGALELAQEMANHASPRTTKLYDRRGDKITQDAVEKFESNEAGTPVPPHELDARGSDGWWDLDVRHRCLFVPLEPIRLARIFLLLAKMFKSAHLKGLTMPNGAGEPKINPTTALVLNDSGSLQRLSAAETLAEAFEDYPITSWLLQNASNQERTRRRFFEVLLEDMAEQNATIEIVGGGAGVSVWMAHDHMSDLTLTKPFRPLLYLLPNAGLRSAARLIRMERVMADFHTREPHFYLFLIGVRRDCQGQGFGSLLLKSCLANADANGRGVFLETSALANIALYRHFGFEVRETYLISRSSPPTWTMWRPPSTSLGR